MITRFVYPRLDMFYKRKDRMERALQLVISSSTEDGKCWFGVRDAIINYCEEYGFDIGNVCWMIKVKPDDDYTEIIAKDIDEWERKFNDLNVVYQEYQ